MDMENLEETRTISSQGCWDSGAVGWRILEEEGPGPASCQCP